MHVLQTGVRGSLCQLSELASGFGPGACTSAGRKDRCYFSALCKCRSGPKAPSRCLSVSPSQTEKAGQRNTGHTQHARQLGELHPDMVQDPLWDIRDQRAQFSCLSLSLSLLLFFRGSAGQLNRKDKMRFYFLKKEFL